LWGETARVWDSVPRRTRHAEQQLIETAEPQALAWLEAARARTSDWTAIADTLRNDPSLSPPVRQAADRKLSRLANPVVLEASRLVRSLRERLLLAADVVAHLEADASVREDLRVEALRLARLFKDGADELNQLAWAVVQSPGAELDAYERAARAARVAVELEPDEGYILRTLGVAMYRTGDFAGALETLTRSDQLNGRLQPADVAFLAMAHFRLGQAESARAELDRLRTLVGEDSNDSFLAEAEATIAPPPAQTENGR
jgi:hypothetical protein